MKHKKKNRLSYFVLIILLLVILFTVIINVSWDNKTDNIEEDTTDMLQPNLLQPYVKEEIDSAISKIRNNQSDNSVSISFISDLHINDSETQLYNNNIDTFTYIANSGLIEASVNGGDLYYGTWQSKDEGKVNLKYTKLLYSRINNPVLFVRGNHDCNIKNNPEEAIDNEFYYNTMLKDLNVVNNSEDPYGGYYYKDLEDKKVRICVLNAFSGDNYQYIFNDVQLQFVAERALNFKDKQEPDKWQVVFFTHTIENSSVHLESVEGKDKLYEIMTAYENADVVSVNNKTIDYTQQGKGKVIAIITGHHHMDLTKNENGFLIITTRAASATYDREYLYEDVKNTKDELAFDVFTVDLDQRVIKATRIGREKDREWNY